MLRLILASGVGAWLPLQAQEPAKTYSIAYLGQGSAKDAPDTGNALPVLLADLRELGYAEGQNLRVDARFAEGHPEDLPRLAEGLVRANPQVIAVPSAGIAEVVLGATKTIPIVALGAGQLQAEVKSLRRPGGNLTGMQINPPAVIGKRLQLLKEVIPKLQRVAVLRGVPFGGPGFDVYRDAIDAAAVSLGVRVRHFQFEQPGELERLFDEMATERDQALMVLSNPHLNLHRKEIWDLAMRHRMPAIYDFRGYPAELLVYSARMDDVIREATTYVDKILKGAQPAELPIGQPARIELVINLGTAKALGLTVPQSLLLRADEVIE